MIELRKALYESYSAPRLINLYSTGIYQKYYSIHFDYASLQLLDLGNSIISMNKLSILAAYKLIMHPALRCLQKKVNLIW
jgi:hypothetical protein